MSDKMIDIFPWNAHFFTGIATIDEQHQKLVAILNRLANHIAFQSSSYELDELFDELSDYVIYHFESEEKIWQQYLADDDLLSAHTHNHGEFNDELTKLKQTVTSRSKNEVLSSALRFLTRWLVTHILQNDMYMAFVVGFIQTGSTAEQAKQQAVEKINGSTKEMIDFILGIYETLSSNTFHLVQEIHKHEITVAKLLHNQDRLDEMQAYAQLGYWDLDVDSQQATWSKQIYTLFGLDPTLPAGPDTLKTITYQGDFDIFSHSIQQCYLTGNEHHITYRIVRPTDGQLRWIECHGKLIKNERGRPEKVSGFIQDITEAKKQQQLLIQQGNQLRFITEHIPVYIAQVSKDHIFKFANKQYAALYGYTPDEIIGLHGRQVLGDDLFNQLLPLIERVFAGEKINYRRHIAKPPYDLSIDYIPEYNSKGEVVGFIVSSTDISDRVESEHYEEFYKSILELLTTNNSLELVLTELIKGLENLYPKMLCSINLLDKDRMFFETVLGPSLPDSYNKQIQGVEIGPGVGSCGTSAYTKKIQIAEDIQTDPNWINYKDLAQAANLRACWSQPILSNVDDVLGTLAIYHSQPHSPSSKDMDIIERSAHLASIAITNCYQRQQLQVAATVFESEQEGMMITDANGILIQVNKAFTNITGYSYNDVIGKRPSILSSGQHDAGFYAEIWRNINQNGSWSGEIFNRKKNGEIYPEFLRISAVYDAEHENIVNYVGTFSDMTSDKKAEESIERLAFYDSLTGLPNRRLCHDRLERALASSAQHNELGFLLALDIDRFKIINDIHGHELGDKFLCQVANRLQFCLREQDTLSRTGGDEFSIILESVSSNRIKAIDYANTLIEELLATANQEFYIDSIAYSCTITIGVTMFDDHKTELSELLKQVDIALFNAKSMGGNSYSFFDPEMQTLINYRAALETELGDAIKSGQLELYLQPQVDQQGSIIGAEALVRWNHPQQGLISPADFIPLAEETGLIIPLGEWVLNEGCRQLKELQQNESQLLSLAINVSAKQFYQERFCDVVTTAINQHNINPKQLKLELTESVLVSDIDKTISVMNELASLGIQFSMDDFGTGYSSLQYLKKLPLTQLKIDQSFVRDIDSDDNDLIITRTIIAMAKNLGLDVIAEGVETTEQLRLLAEEGCPLFQGYLFHKPLPFNEFVALFNQSTK